MLVPRPETELLVEVALGLPRGARVLDVGTGSGAVALALKHERPDLEVVATDLSSDALEVARANALALRLDVAFVQGDLLAGVDGGFDAILSNPPYVPDGDRAQLEPEVAVHEPAQALFAGARRPRRAAPARRRRRRARPVRRVRGRRRPGARRRRAARRGRDDARTSPPRPGGDRARGGGAAVITTADAAAFVADDRLGGVAVFPADTVYGLRLRPSDPAAVARLYELKGRPPTKPAAVMFFDRERALAALPELGPRTRGALERLLPGGVTLLLPDPEAAEAEGGEASGGSAAAADAQPALGLRVPRLDGPLAPLAGVELAVLQSSANLAGGADPRTLDDVPAAIRGGVDLVLDAGPLPGTPSTVVDLRRYEAERAWEIVRAGAVSADEIAAALG